jgi:phosphoglycolate phosphatase-like HAD superfamily hydrolase
VNLNIENYETIIFDCDGVILDSNKIKSDAFYNVAFSYGKDAAESLRRYHVLNGGVSRYVKFEYFISSILCKPVLDEELHNLLSLFSIEVKNALLSCDVADGLLALRALTESAVWIIASGGDQEELREVFEEKGLAQQFNGGIYGSPDNKDEIIRKGISLGFIKEPCLFIGDSKYDYQSAHNAEFDFLFLFKWTEVDDWPRWVENEAINSAKDIASLINGK